MKITTRKLVTLGALAACSIVLALIIHIPFIPPASFLEYDPADIPILIGTFLFGPWWGLALTVVVAVLQGFTVSSASGVYGIIMHIIATGAYVLVSGLIYNHSKNRKTAYIAIGCGVLAMTAIMVPANLIVTPAFTGWPVSGVVEILPYILLFNLMKAGINGVVTALVYKRIHKFLTKINLA